jgi:hypothetical protein
MTCGIIAIVVSNGSLMCVLHSNCPEPTGFQGIIVIFFPIHRVSGPRTSSGAENLPAISLRFVFKGGLHAINLARELLRRVKEE